MTSAIDEAIQTFMIPDAYSKLGVATGFAPATPDELMIVVEALSNAGKSTFVASDPKSIILDFDLASKNVYGSKAQYVPIASWDTYLAIQAQLLQDKQAGHCPWSRVVFDTGDSFADLLDISMVAKINERRSNSADIATMAEFGDGRIGYTKMRAEFMRQLTMFKLVGFALTICLQLREDTEKVGDQLVTHRRALIAPGIRRALGISVDMACRLYSEKATRKVYKTKVIRGREQRFESGTETVRKYYLDVMPDDKASGGAQKRRILGLEQAVELPPVDGWKVFGDNYDGIIANLQHEPPKEPNQDA